MRHHYPGEGFLAAEQVAELLSGLSPEVRAIGVALREVVRENTTDAYEKVYHDTIAYSPNRSPGDMIFFIAPVISYVRLGFFFGSSLGDPHGVLEGVGKRMRHVKVRSEAEARQLAIGELVREAWEEGPRHYAEARSK